MTSRLKLLAEIIHVCRLKKIDPQTFLHLRIEKLPFKLGEGKGKIPFLIERDLAENITSSLQHIVGLIKKRNEREMRYSLQSYMPLTAQRQPKDIMERYLCIRDLNARPLEKRIAEDAIYHNPYLDAGIVETWFLQYKEPGKLISTLKRLYLKAIEEEIRHGEETDITYLTHLCVVAYLKKAKKVLKEVNIKGFSYERLEQAVGQLLYSMLQVIQENVFNEIRYKDLSVDVSRTEHRIKGSTNPLSFVAIRPTLFKNDLNPYHLDQEGFELLQTLMHKIDLRTNNLEETLKSLVLRAKKSKEVRAKITELWSYNKIREAVFNYLKDYEDYRGGKNIWLFNLFQMNKVIESALASDEVGKKIEEDLSNLIAETSHAVDKEQMQRAIGIENAFKSQKRGNTMKKLFFSSSEEGHIQDVIEGFLLYHLDDLWSGYVEESLTYLDDRAVLKKRIELEDEYEKGRIYRLAVDTKPLIQDLKVKKEGHLFMDLRGFTQRMSRSKEIITADFMLKEFFLPVLDVAKNYYTDSGVRLNNLVGDAISFSGRIRPLVSLAREIREILARYTEHIKEQEGVFGERDETRATGERYQQERKSIIRERTDIEESIRGIEQRLKLKEFLNPVHLIQIQEEEFNAKFVEYQQQIKDLPNLIAREENAERKKTLIDFHENVLGLQEGITEQKRELMESIGCFGEDDLNSIFRSVCAEEREELERLRQLLKASYDKESDLNRAYEMEIASGSDAGIEYGLFISYGDAAETISFEDPFWGKMSVAIAEKLNEAARGTGRNPDIKNKLDVLLRNSRKARGNPSLAYPFSVFVDRSYGLSLRSDLSGTIQKALQNRDKDTARVMMETISSHFMHDIEKGMRGTGDDGWEIINYFNDIYNLGEAISGDALQAFLKEVSPHTFYFEKTVKISTLHQDIQRRFFFPYDELQLTVCAERVDDQLQFDLFRYVGELIFKGFSMHQATAVYELVRRNSPLCMLLERHHVPAWYQEARGQNGGVQTAYG